MPPLIFDDRGNCWIIDSPSFRAAFGNAGLCGDAPAFLIEHAGFVGVTRHRAGFVIRFNPERGYEEEALVLARRLFARFDEAITSLTLMPVADEDLALSVDGWLVRSLSQSGQAPRAADVPAPCNSKGAGGR